MSSFFFGMKLREPLIFLHLKTLLHKHTLCSQQTLTIFPDLQRLARHFSVCR